MNEPLTYKDVIKLHIEKFGVEPKITGIRAFDETPLIERVYKAIEEGKPYEEEEVPEGVVV